MANKKEESSSREEVIGYHKGCLNTLIAERTELLRIVNITESLMQAHVKALSDMGIKLETQKSSK
jgi:hypothetical protein